MMNLLDDIIQNIKYDYEQWKWSRPSFRESEMEPKTSNSKPEIDWNFILGLMFGISYLIFGV